MRKSAPAAHRILLVDDNKDGLKIRKIVLEQHGFQVMVCDCPLKALECFSEYEFDAIVTDYRMPAMNGDDLITRLRAARPELPIVLISGLVEALGLTAESTGADAVVPKTATEIANLVRALERLLRPGASRKPPQPQRRNAARRAVRQPS